MKPSATRVAHRHLAAKANIVQRMQDTLRFHVHRVVKGHTLWVGSGLGGQKVSLLLSVREPTGYGGDLVLNPFSGKWRATGFAPAFDPEGGSRETTAQGRIQPWPLAKVLTPIRNSEVDLVELEAAMRGPQWSALTRWADRHLEPVLQEVFHYAAR